MRLSSRFIYPVVIFCLVTFVSCQPHILEQERNGKTLTIWTLQLADFKDYLEPIFTEFEKQHPGVHVKWVDIPFSEGEKKALTAILSKQAPDVINLNPDFSAVLANKGTLVDINEMVTPEERASYLSVAWQACTLKSVKSLSKSSATAGNAAKASQTFGIPWYITSAITYENKALLKEAGLRQFPVNEEGLMVMAQRLKARGNHYAFFPTLAENGKFLKYLYQLGIDYQSPEGLITLTSPKAVAVLTHWVSFYQSGLVPKESLTQGHQDAMERYQSGGLAMLVAGTTAIKNIESNAPSVFKHTKLAPQFPQSSPNIDFSVMTLVVPKTSKHPQEAVALALFMTNKLNSVRFSERAPVLPSNTFALKQVIHDNQSKPDFASRALALSGQQLLSARQAFQIHPLQKQLNQIIDFYVQSALLGRTTPEVSLQCAEREMNAIVQE